MHSDINCQLTVLVPRCALTTMGDFISVIVGVSFPYMELHNGIVYVYHYLVFYAIQCRRAAVALWLKCWSMDSDILGI